MASISGFLRHVTGNADRVSSVGVAAVRPRPGGDGVITSTPEVFPVGDDGKVSFPCEPGAAVLTIYYTHGAVESVPILVGAGSSSLRDVFAAAHDTAENSESGLQALAVEARSGLQGIADAAERVKAAGVSAEAAAASEKAASQQAAAASQQAAAASSSAGQAKLSQQAAAQSAQQAGASAQQAATSASSAQQAASTASQAIASTHWDGDQLTVMGKQSGHLTGPKGDKGDPGQPGKDGATTWDAIQGKPAGYPAYWDQIVNKPQVFPPTNHNHTSSQISDAQPYVNNPAYSYRVLRTNGSGRLYVTTPTEAADAVNKQYVDSALAAKATMADVLGLIVEGNTGATDGKLHVVFE